MVKTLGRSFAAFLLAETVLIASAFGWVAIYSHILQPGRDVAHYEAYAMTSSPYVSLLAGPPLFYLACRYLRAHGLLVFAFFCLIEVPVLLLSDTSSIPGWIFAAGFSTKLLACWFGGKANR